MDLQVAYGIAPGAAQVVYYLPDDGYPGVAKSMVDADQRWPGAIWSLSLGFGCDGFDKPDDIKDVRTAIENAEKRGTSVFVSSGDTGGYECKGQIPNQPDFYGPPVADDIGVSTLAALPPVTDVGGTTLSTDANGAWADEMGWSEYTVTNGTGGGVSRLFERPDWQRGVSVPPGSAATIASLPDPPDPATRRLTPDVAADADPATGVAIYECGDDDTDCQAQPGGGTSQAAPIWAALTALMNEYLTSHGGQPVSNVNPLLYKAAASGARPGFRDVTAGGNCVYNSAPGFNLATGLGTPNTINLVQDILDIQKTGPVR
jgi:kumamolisin